MCQQWGISPHHNTAIRVVSLWSLTPKKRRQKKYVQTTEQSPLSILSIIFFWHREHLQNFMKYFNKRSKKQDFFFYSFCYQVSMKDLKEFSLENLVEPLSFSDDDNESSGKCFYCPHPLHSSPLFSCLALISLLILGHRLLFTSSFSSATFSHIQTDPIHYYAAVVFLLALVWLFIWHTNNTLGPSSTTQY